MNAKSDVARIVANLKTLGTIQKLCGVVCMIAGLALVLSGPNNAVIGAPALVLGVILLTAGYYTDWMRAVLLCLAS